MADNSEQQQQQQQQQSTEESMKELVDSQRQCQQWAAQCEELSAMVGDLSPDSSTKNGATATASVSDSAVESQPEVTSSEGGAVQPSNEEAVLNAVNESSLAPPAGDGEITDENAPIVSAEEMEMASLKVKIMCQEKYMMALRMELKCAELQAAEKEKINSKKTRLIELLDRKIGDLESKNIRLVEMMERMVQEKDTHTQRLVDATKNMEEMGKKLMDSERMRQELRVVNHELRTMLEKMEGKGTQIARLAKEKVLKYREENMKMQQQIDNFKTAEAANGLPGAAESMEPETTGLAADEQGYLTGAIGLRRCMDEAEALVSSLVSEFSSASSEASDEPAAPRSKCALLVESLQLKLIELRHNFVDVMAAKCASDVITAQTSKVAELEKENADLKRAAEELAAKNGPGVSEELAAKVKEIGALKIELARLRAAIGQLVGFGAGPPDTPTSATGQ